MHKNNELSPVFSMIGLQIKGVLCFNLSGACIACTNCVSGRESFKGKAESFNQLVFKRYSDMYCIMKCIT